MAEAAVIDIDETSKIMEDLQFRDLCSWGSSLHPAPVFIATLGQLLGIATKQDFRLDKYEPQRGFQHLKYPHSFRASLVQISNLVCETFMAADKSMNIIGVQTHHFLETFKIVKNIAKYGTEEEKQQLPDLLNDLKRYLNKCHDNAEKTDGDFNAVVYTLNEISEATAGAKGIYENCRKETANELEYLREEEKRIEAVVEEMKKIKLEILEKLTKAESKFEESIENVPGTKTIFAVETFGSVVELAKDGLNVFAQMKTFGLSAVMSGLGNSARANSNQRSGSNEVDNQEEIQDQITECIESIQSEIDSLIEILNVEENADVRTMENENLKLSEIASELDNMQKKLKTLKIAKKTKMKKCLEVIKEVKNICSDIPKRSKKGNAKDLNAKLCKKKEILQKIHEHNMLPKTTDPMPSHKQSDERRSVSDKILQAAEYSVDVRKERLSELQKEYKEYLLKQSESGEHHLKVLSNLAKLNIDKVDFDQIRIVINKGVSSLGEMKSQWTTLLKFMESMTISLDTALELTCKIEKSKMKIFGSSKRFILETCGQVESIAYGVHLIAKSYKSISRGFLLPNVSRLNMMISYDAETESEQLEEARQNLMKELEKTESEIKRLEQEGNRLLELKVREAQQRLNLELVSA